MAILKLQTGITSAVSSFTSLKYSNHAIVPVYNDLVKLEKNSFNQSIVSTFGKIQPMEFNDEIDVESLYFRYENNTEDTLENINLSIQKGSSVGLVGKTGAGKSTLIDIILGLLEPTEGVIKVDGIPILKRLRTWQSNIGYIPQDIYLLGNIALGMEDKEVDIDKLRKALEIAQIADLIKSLPNGWDTATGERGIRLSGGQLQRVGIARALYHNPDILVMDEATSSLDTSTEQSVMKALDYAKKGRTFIMIAHRLSTVKKCHQIYLLKEGKLISSGSYDDLASKSSEFQQMIADNA